MDLDITKRQREGIWILDLRGCLVMGDSEAILRRVIATMAGGGALSVVLNFAAVSEIDAEGFGALAFCIARVLRLNGALKILNLGSSHMNPMVTAKLAAVLEVFSDEQDAVNSFFPDRAIRSRGMLE